MTTLDLRMSNQGVKIDTSGIPEVLYYVKIIGQKLKTEMIEISLDKFSSALISNYLSFPRADFDQILM